MSEATSVGAIVIYIMPLLYMVIGTLIEKYELSFGHEASITILIGMCISYISYISDDTEFGNMLKFDDNTFFFVCLPPIVFASGFNMQRGNFFSNFSSIALFGVVGTLVAFLTFTTLTITLNNYGFMRQYDPKTQITGPL